MYMEKDVKSGGLITRFFKFLFKGVVNDGERKLKTDPELQRRSKKLQQSVDELQQYMEENFPDEYK